MQAEETRFYRFAELTVRLDGPSFSEAAHLAPFRIEAPPDGRADVRFAVRVRADMQPPVGEAIHSSVFLDVFDTPAGRLRAIYMNGKRTAEDIMLLIRELGQGAYEAELSSSKLQYYHTNAVLEMFELPGLLLDNGGFMLHASYINTKYGAVLFTAKKQTGKSTQAALWEKHRGAFVANGDRAALRRIGGAWYACGSPYCGTSKICYNITEKLCALVILGQAGENSIRRAGAREAMTALLSGATFDTWDVARMERATSLFEGLTLEVPVLRLDCVPDESAVCALEEVLCGMQSP